MALRRGALVFFHCSNSDVTEVLNAANSVWARIRQLQVTITGATRRLEKQRTDRGHHLPVAVERIDVAIGDASAQMPVDVL
jgi:hypothetical protein